jgi:hypothetical protein
MAQVWRRTCGVTARPASEGHLVCATAAYLRTRNSTASALSILPRLVGNTGSEGVTEHPKAGLPELW